MFKQTLSIALIAAALTTQIQADTFNVTITNMTVGQVLTPPVIITHDKSVKLFTPGQPAPSFLIPLAEGGHTDAFKDIDKSFSIISDVVLATGPVKPGKSLTMTVQTTTSHPYISVAGMLASTNDSFAAINSHKLDFNADTQMMTAAVYDAGTEFNSEKCEFIPGPPCGNDGVRDTEKAEGYVYISNGVHGIGDLPAATFTWLNPAIRVVISRTK